MEKRQDPSSYLYSGNASYLADLLRLNAENPENLSEEWRHLLAPFRQDGLESVSDRPSSAFLSQGQASRTPDLHAIMDSIRALMMIRAYRVRGHLLAHLDPLNLEDPLPHPDLELSTYGFETTDLDREIYIDGHLGYLSAKLRDIVAKLKQTYCQSVGVEFMHIQDLAQRRWIQDRFEGERPKVAPAEQQEILFHLLRAEALEKFLHVKFPGAKRFGLEGGESLIPAMEALFAHAVKHGVEEVVLGMAHRGRLNILANLLGAPKHHIFGKFKDDVPLPEDFSGSGDVKYHLGYSADRLYGDRQLHLSLTANPSHLEAVDPVVLGKVRAKQHFYKDTQRSRVMGLLLHGDAAFAGQGLVAETLELSGLRGYRTGGILHIIINNQIGFTTSPPHSRSSPYSSDIAKAIQAPIIHVNADDVEAMVWAIVVADDFRRKFSQDVVVDMICYRRHGHNEGDEPSFTQPMMYKAIAQQETTQNLYRHTLIAAGVISAEDADALQEPIQAELRHEFENAQAPLPQKSDWLSGAWAGIKACEESLSLPVTGVDVPQLQKIGEQLTQIPKGFNLHQKLHRLFEQKKVAISSGKSLDWSMAESLAFGSLLAQGHSIRLSGQDSGRGTFSQRHAILVDQQTEEKYSPLSHIATSHNCLFEIVDSPLAEASVLGFEYGYSSANPHGLTIWEAQFGDFSNGAQVIIDQFISSAEAKWLRLSGLVMLLPHGFEGQGPDHSSARLERFLQLCAEGNLRVVNCSTPANYFHCLRRQILDESRKPLILMTPKSLLRHPEAISTLEDMGKETRFLSVIPDTSSPLKTVKRVILCSGKVYYDLLAARKQHQITDVALIRLEQLYPFPAPQLTQALSEYKNADLIWCQEEPMNMGAWYFLDRRLEEVLAALSLVSKRPVYVGRPPAAAPATGILSRHQAEQEKLVTEALLNRKG